MSFSPKNSLSGTHEWPSTNGIVIESFSIYSQIPSDNIIAAK